MRQTFKLLMQTPQTVGAAWATSLCLRLFPSQPEQ